MAEVIGWLPELRGKGCEIAVLLAYASGDNVGLADVVELTGYGERQVRRARGRLEEVGAITVARDRNSEHINVVPNADPGRSHKSGPDTHDRSQRSGPDIEDRGRGRPDRSHKTAPDIEDRSHKSGPDTHDSGNCRSDSNSPRAVSTTTSTSSNSNEVGEGQYLSTINGLMHARVGSEPWPLGMKVPKSLRASQCNGLRVWVNERANTPTERHDLLEDCVNACIDSIRSGKDKPAAWGKFVDDINDWHNVAKQAQEAEAMAKLSNAEKARVLRDQAQAERRARR